MAAGWIMAITSVFVTISAFLNLLSTNRMNRMIKDLQGLKPTVRTTTTLDVGTIRIPVYTAIGHDLDAVGGFWDLRRELGEADATFRGRIIDIILKTCPIVLT